MFRGVKAWPKAFVEVAEQIGWYNAHAAWEDTVIFPSWKKMQSKARMEELAGKFEDLEKEKFGKDGFDDAVARISQIEGALGLGDLGVFTAPPPPAA